MDARWIFTVLFLQTKRDVGLKIQGIPCIFSIGHGLASTPIGLTGIWWARGIEAKISPPFSTKCLLTNVTSDAIFYCDLLCVLLFLLLINTHLVICYVNAGKHVKETQQANTNTNTNILYIN